MKLFWVFILAVSFISNSTARIDDNIQITKLYSAHRPRYSQYFYKALNEKLRESSIVLLPSCSLFSKAEMYVGEIKPENKDIEAMDAIRKYNRYYEISSSLCNASEYHSYMDGKISICPMKQKRGHFHPSHPRCHIATSKSACNPKAKLISRPSQRDTFSQYPFVVKMLSVSYISRSGMIYSKCGILGLTFNGVQAGTVTNIY